MSRLIIYNSPSRAPSGLVNTVVSTIRRSADGYIAHATTGVLAAPTLTSLRAGALVAAESPASSAVYVVTAPAGLPEGDYTVVTQRASSPMQWTDEVIGLSEVRFDGTDFLSVVQAVVNILGIPIEVEGETVNVRDV